MHRIKINKSGTPNHVLFFFTPTKSPLLVEKKTTMKNKTFEFTPFALVKWLHGIKTSGSRYVNIFRWTIHQAKNISGSK